MENEKVSDESAWHRTSDKPETDGGGKIPYSKPTLTVHGTVEDLTAKVGGGPTDGLAGSLVG